MTELIGYVVGTTLNGLIMLGIATMIELAAPRGTLPLVSRLRGIFLLVSQGLIIGGPLNFALLKFWASLRYSPLATLPLDHALNWAGPASTTLELVAYVLILDLVEYLYHRFQHLALWRLHGIHHCVVDLSASTNYGHFLEAPFRYLLLIAPFSLIEIRHGPQPMWLPLLLAMKETYIHSPTKLNFGPLRYLLVDNNFHRIHHSRDPAHLNKNFGIITPLWDVVFRTAYFPKPDEWPQTGVDGMPEPQTFVEFLVFPFRGLWARSQKRSGLLPQPEKGP